MQISLTSVLSLARLHPRKSMPSITRFGHPPRSFWPQVATAVAALLLSGAACADMAGGLLVSPTSLNFGSVALGATSASQQVTVTNTTSAPIGPLSVGSGVSAPWGSGTGCSGVTLAAGTSCSSTYTFTPTALGPQVSSGEGITINGVKVPMSFVGTGVQGLRVTPTSLNFGDVIVNTTSPGQVLTVTNITSAPVTIASSSAGAMAPFAYSGNCPGITLASGASCTYTYTFLPTTLGARATPAGTEFVVNGQATPISLQGTGVASIPPGALLITPSELNFGDVPIGATSAPQSTTLTNISGLTVPISFISGALPGGEFGGGTATNNCGPALAAGASCVLSTYTFSPTSAGAQTGSVTETV
ncbi:MAG: choice-of-anchor D domain-containing protein, partial [Acidovorax temperans]|uniref:choice-of-anchor D domain-containing protein n=1 Tax=Acidovorax temperans TaxID=80878 RepID=UPI00391C0712